MLFSLLEDPPTVSNSNGVLVSVSLEKLEKPSNSEDNLNQEEVEFGIGSDTATTTTFAEYTDTVQAEPMAASQIRIQKPAPFFKGRKGGYCRMFLLLNRLLSLGTAVVDGVFKEISLDDYKGKYVVLFFYPLDL